MVDRALASQFVAERMTAGWERQRLRRAALRFAAHGWPVTPGACRRGDRFDCGRLGCPTATCHPALERWEQAASRDPDRIAGWWRYAPHSLLLPTGYACDVIEVPAALAVPAAPSGWEPDARGPVAALPTGRWMFFVDTGEPLRPALASRLDVLRHCQRSWVPLPPTRLGEGPVRWMVSPAEVGWRLPASGQVQERLAAAIPAPTPVVSAPLAPRDRRAQATAGGCAISTTTASAHTYQAK